jgi:taurine--2-oxoglutarate transaminase
VGDVRGIGGLWTVELVRDRETKEPLVPVGATGEANAPMTTVLKVCLGRGLVPLILGNRIHVAPPLNVSDGDAAIGGHPGRGVGCSRHIPGLSVFGLGVVSART